MHVGKICVLISMLVFISCKQDNVVHDFDGAWNFKETYENWKKGDVEGLSANESIIAGKKHLVINHSMIIDTSANPMYLSVPGGKWIINDIRPFGKTAYNVLLRSTESKETTGILILNCKNDKSIWFSIGKMDPDFQKEFNQSFLLVGEEEIYVKCDQIKQ